jgi:truncated hemoglobin YjbI/tellurite resistance-related uncharacterized protein
VGVKVEEQALPCLLKTFYGRVRDDAELGPVFNNAVQDWPLHLARLADFWSSIMLTSGRYKGNPMKLHLRHASRITASMFERWLSLWRRTTDEMLSAENAASMQAKADRIAESLQLALQLRTPAEKASMLGEPAASAAASGPSIPYRKTPVFDAATLPSALQHEHSTKAGVWGLIRVLEGCVRYCIEGEKSGWTLMPGQPGRVLPQQLHHVELMGPMRMQVEFYDHEPRLK